LGKQSHPRNRLDPYVYKVEEKTHPQVAKRVNKIEY